MTAESLKEVLKAVKSAVTESQLPLSDELIQIIHSYLEKHGTTEDCNPTKLQEELLSIYQKDVADKPSRLATFLAVIRFLRPAISGSGRLIQWWDILSGPMMAQLGEEKGLAGETQDTLLDILVYDEDDKDLDGAIKTARTLAENLMSIWLEKAALESTEFDDEARFVGGKLQQILVAFGKKRPKDFLITIDKFFVKRESRIMTLSLLCEFIRFQPPHLYQLLETPLFENMLRCLQIDTSTRVISLAMTALIMFLPHIPSSLAKYLPALFNIYSRMLFWDRERRASSESFILNDGNGENDDHEPLENTASTIPNIDTTWDKQSFLLESDDETVPELLHYFTFLYGLYPLNFMSYIRKPQRYLRHANFPSPDDLDIQPTEIRQRSETFRQLHLLHPNFFTMTIETELTDNNRWINSEPSDVVADCMALYNPGVYDSTLQDASRKARPEELKAEHLDVPEEPLLTQEVTSNSSLSRHTSWRNTTSTAVASPSLDGGRTLSGILRKASQTSHTTSTVDERSDSPTLHPHRTSSSSNVNEMLNYQKSLRGSLQQTFANDSVQSLALSHHTLDNAPHVDSYLQSMPALTTPRSPSLRPANADPQTQVAYLLREIMLLKNDLNFERYLKQQHLSHIGRLRRKQIREARVEAETQNLVNSNRTLKNKLEEAKRTIVQMKKEFEKSKSHSRKWETDLTAKLRILKEEQKKWGIEGDQLRGDLTAARDECANLTRLVAKSESETLLANQKLQSIQASLNEMESLRAEVERLRASVREYEAAEDKAERDLESREAALSQVEVLKLQLAANERELVETRKAFEKRIQDLEEKQENASAAEIHHTTQGTKQLLDSALATSRSRFIEIQKAHNHLLKRYTALQAAYMELKDQGEGSSFNDEPLLSSISSRRVTDIPHFYHNGSPPFSNPSSIRNSPPNSASGSSGLQRHPSRLDSSGSGRPQPRPNSSEIQRTGGQPLYPHPGTEYVPGTPLGSLGPKDSFDGDSSHRSESPDIKKARIKPDSEIRIYGRGGVQNIGKKDKDKAKKAADDKKDKKSVGIRGIRNFVG
ncbi:Hamartin protein-domain-containing protein [Xylogone sp. PMI_703]|nr:Hamartin protein-domain-containing protein [Xylogone sp. PMI_703]